MALHRDETGLRKVALLRLLADLMGAVEPAVTGAVVVGSLGYSWTGSLFTTSDLDLVLIGERNAFPTVLAALPPDERVLVEPAEPLLIRGAIDLVSLKACRGGLPFTLHYLDEGMLVRICHFTPGTLLSFRTAPKTGDTLLHSFTGSTLNHEHVSHPLPGGWCHEVPTSVEQAGRWYVGIAHGQFLHCPHLYLDRTGRIAGWLEALWEAFLRRLVQEAGKPVDLQRWNPLLALANARHFEPPVVAALLAKTQRTLTTMGISFLS